MNDFVRRYKLESRDGRGASECIRISGFVHEITNPELIKRLYDKIPKTVGEMMRVTTSFLKGEVAASNHERKKIFPPWKQHESSQKQNFKKGGFQNQQRSERKHDRFSLLTKTPKEIFALDKGNFKVPPPMTTSVEKQNHAKFCEFHGNFKVPPPMTTSVEKQNHAKFCEFHGEVGHNTDKCMHLRKQIEERLKVGKLSRLIKEIRQTNGKEKHKSFSPNPEIFFPPHGEDEGTEGLMIIEAEIGGHCVHHIGEIIWPIGKIQLLVKIGDEEHSALAWMNFMIVRTQPAETPSATKPIAEERVKVAINPEYPEQTVMIGSTLTEGGHDKLCGLLQRNLDIFAWKPVDMTGVPRHITKHRLNVREGCSPIRQKKRGQAADRN
nr:hypothetical protein [Tanacetum cinerariifolium]